MHDHAHTHAYTSMHTQSERCLFCVFCVHNATHLPMQRGTVCLLAAPMPMRCPAQLHCTPPPVALCANAPDSRAHMRATTCRAHNAPGLFQHTPPPLRPPPPPRPGNSLDGGCMTHPAHRCACTRTTGAPRLHHGGSGRGEAAVAHPLGVRAGALPARVGGVPDGAAVRQRLVRDAGVCVCVCSCVQLCACGESVGQAGRHAQARV